MQVKLGEKIKELRKRDGRKQEDLAIALGVTNQAVSRWEANGGYPDMQMIPAIANYFHVTIDELFGYNNDRNIKLQDYLKQAQKLFLNDNEENACIEFLRNALSEFPSDPQLQILLAAVLHKKGCQQNDCKNPYWQEATALYEKLLEEDHRCIIPLISLYSLMGEYEKAEETAKRQPSVEICKEVMLTKINDSSKGNQYRGKAILSILRELMVVIDDSVSRNDVLAHDAMGLQLLLSVVSVYDALFSEGNCGRFHSDLGMLYLNCTEVAANLNDYAGALRYFDNAYEQYLRYEQWLAKGGEIFDTPLLREVHEIDVPVLILQRSFLEDIVKSLPVELADVIAADEKYSNVFQNGKQES